MGKGTICNRAMGLCTFPNVSSTFFFFNFFFLLFRFSFWWITDMAWTYLKNKNKKIKIKTFNVLSSLVIRIKPSCWFFVFWAYDSNWKIFKCLVFSFSSFFLIVELFNFLIIS